MTELAEHARSDRLLFVAGTRAEVVKIAPIIMEAIGADWCVQPVLLNTAQQPATCEEFIRQFGIQDITVNSSPLTRGSLPKFMASIIEECSKWISGISPSYVLVQGDTSSAVAATLAAFYLGYPVAHVEAGLRSFRTSAPWPEEMNRRIISQVATTHFCPTQVAADNLLREGVGRELIHIVGNTVVDALRLASAKPREAVWPPDAIVCTMHRREHSARDIVNVARAAGELGRLSARRVIFVEHVHDNRQEEIRRGLSGTNIEQISSMEYLDFISLISSAALLVTDSGGVTEEAVSLGVPVVVAREACDRGLSAVGGIPLFVAGLDRTRVVSGGRRLLERANTREPSDAVGDGFASRRIMAAMRRLLDV